MIMDISQYLIEILRKNIIPDTISGLIIAGILAIISYLFKDRIIRIPDTLRNKEDELFEREVFGINVKVKKSKDYGPDKEWILRTLYSLNKKDLKKYEYIKFKVEDTNISIYMKTSELRMNITDDDNTGTIKVCINAKKNDDFFITKLGNARSIYQLKPVLKDDFSFYELEK